MLLTQLFQKEARTYSFEFYPPKDQIQAVDFGINVGQLMRLQPSFVSVTYGAGGSTQNRTFELVEYLQQKVGITTVAHYTCINATAEKALRDLTHLHQNGLENFMLLRGDLPTGVAPTANHLSHAGDLIALARRHFPQICIGAGAYPEVHPGATSPEADLAFLVQKVAKGANFLITQFFFDNARYFDFVSRARAAGITCRIIPGIIPLTRYAQLETFLRLSQTHLPAYFLEQLEQYKNNPQKIYQIGMDFAIRQCRDLLIMGAPGLHFYTLNKSRATVEIYQTLLAH